MKGKCHGLCKEHIKRKMGLCHECSDRALEFIHLLCSDFGKRTGLTDIFQIEHEAKKFLHTLKPEMFEPLKEEKSD